MLLDEKRVTCFTDLTFFIAFADASLRLIQTNCEAQHNLDQQWGWGAVGMNSTTGRSDGITFFSLRDSCMSRSSHG